MKEWNMKIRKVNNGYIAEHMEQESEYEYKHVEHVFQMNEEEPEDSKHNREVFAGLLRYLTDYFDEQGSKHDHHRISIDVDKLREDEDVINR